jgi:hypothetical protein
MTNESHPDIERKPAEEKLRESQEMHVGILTTVPQSIFWEDRNSV